MPFCFCLRLSASAFLSSILSGAKNLLLPSLPASPQNLLANRQASPAIVSLVPQKPPHRSGCPVSISLEIFGDRWSLLIIRDLMTRGYRTFRQFQEAGEGIASNILADRLHKLEAARILTAEPAPDDARRIHYRLTEKVSTSPPCSLSSSSGARVMKKPGAPCEVMAEMAKNRDVVLAETRRRWLERDSTPLLPKFGTADVSRSWRKPKRNSNRAA